MATAVALAAQKGKPNESLHPLRFTEGRAAHPALFRHEVERQASLLDA